jgi:hypothetical protein
LTLGGGVRGGCYQDVLACVRSVACGGFNIKGGITAPVRSVIQ